jgi:hypothetical protein
VVQVVEPLLLNRQVLVKVSPGLKLVPSGTVTSLMKLAASPVVLNWEVPCGVPVEGVTVKGWVALFAVGGGVSVAVGGKSAAVLVQVGGNTVGVLVTVATGKFGEVDEAVFLATFELQALRLEIRMAIKNTRYMGMRFIPDPFLSLPLWF